MPSFSRLVLLPLFLRAAGGFAAAAVSADAGAAAPLPRLRVHLVDLSTGRYLLAEHVARPPGGKPAPSVPGAVGSGDARSPLPQQKLPAGAVLSPR